MKKLYRIVCIFINLFKVSTNPENTKAALDITKHLRALGFIQREIDALSSDSKGREVIQQRKLLNPIDVSVLSQCPEGSLGKVYADHMIEHGLHPEFYEKVAIDDDASFCMMRLRQTHDIWHMITGFDTSVPGELGLQAFMMAQVSSPLSPLLIGGRLFTAALKNPAEAHEILEQVSLGWRLGKESAPLFAVDWDQEWKTPLTDLQRQLLWTVENKKPFVVSHEGSL